jgi:predicted TIM-barrel fold metal-dependent hydrolase
MDNLIIASADGHAVMPPNLWTHYLEKPYHRYLDRLRNERDLFSGSMLKLTMRMLEPAYEAFDKEEIYRSGKWNGLWDREVRLQEMDREGVVAEFTFFGDTHGLDMFFNNTNATYPTDAMDAGARAFNRWCADEFGPAKGRILMAGAPITGLDLDAAVAEAKWIADHGFTGMMTPGTVAVPNQPPVYDKYWDPLWAVLAERNVVVITHAGWGLDQGFMHSEVEAAAAENKAEGGDEQQFLKKLMEGLFRPRGVFDDLRSRRGMWQIMLGGVFDRHPKLKMMETEVRADWIPAVLKHLDAFWEKHRDVLPAKRKPSEYWAEHCMAGLSFMNKVEVQMRDEIGVAGMAFGRDYPHTEGTWPNTRAYLSDLFRGVSETDTRAILGENLVRFLGLDRAQMAAIAQRIKAPNFKDIAEGPGLTPALAQHLNIRCGYSNAAEGASRIPEMDVMLQSDLRRMAVA